MTWIAFFIGFTAGTAVILSFGSILGHFAKARQIPRFRVRMMIWDQDRQFNRTVLDLDSTSISRLLLMANEKLHDEFLVQGIPITLDFLKYGEQKTQKSEDSVGFEIPFDSA